MRGTQAGDELFIEYQLAIDDLLDERVRQQYVYRCGATTWRGSMLAADG